jgi:hypothetical protein
VSIGLTGRVGLLSWSFDRLTNDIAMAEEYFFLRLHETIFCRMTRLAYPRASGLSDMTKAK